MSITNSNDDWNPSTVHGNVYTFGEHPRNERIFIYGCVTIIACVWLFTRIWA